MFRQCSKETAERCFAWEVTNRLKPRLRRSGIERCSRRWPTMGSTIAVKRRWGVYLADFGRLCVVLEADGRQQAVYADEKHYVASPDRLQAILDVIYSFDKEFGCKFDYGPVAVSGVRDYRDVGLASVAGAVVLLASGSGIVVWYFRRRKLPAELAPRPDSLTSGDSAWG